MMPDFAAAGAAGGPPCYQPYADSIGSMPHPKYTLHYGAYGAQYIYTAIQGSPSEALEYQTESSNWQLEQELCDNYLATQLYDHVQTTTGDMPSDPVAHPSLTSITSGFYYDHDSDTNLFDSSACQDAASADPQIIANEVLYNPPQTTAMQAALQPNVPSDFAAQSCICPAVLEPPVIPSPRQSRRRASRRATSSSIGQFPSSPGAPRLRTYKRRNVQVPSELATMSVQGPTTGHADPWRCPHCPYVQHNHRSPDFNRHIATHSPLEKAQWVCCGVPVFDAQAQGVPESVVHEEPFEHEGLLMVGGCQKTFSRRDALGRHLRSGKGRCFGDASAMYQPGNRAELM